MTAALDITEAAWQQQVEDLLRIHGWRWLHVRKSVGRRGGKRAWQTTTNLAGWPDIFAWHPALGFVALELKSRTGKPTSDQLDVLHELSAAGARTMVARPADIDTVVALLRGQAA